MKTYLCKEKCFFRNRLHYEGVFYRYGDDVEMPVSKRKRQFFELVTGEQPAKVQAGGLGEQVINPAPDVRKPLVVDTTEEPEPIRPSARGRVKTGINAEKTKG